MDQRRKIIIGTRGSQLAMTQTGMVRDALLAVRPDLEIEIKEILTSGDWKSSDGEVRLSTQEGGKGQFAKEIEHAMINGEIDIAVHSMKDMDSNLPAGLVINHMLPREDARDVLLFSDRANACGLTSLPSYTIIGTASVRRQAMILSANNQEGIEVRPLRGNVGTRIEKVRRGDVDVTLLAAAGLKRLGLEAEADYVLSLDEMLPAAGQGAVGIEMRAADQDIADLLDQISCAHTLRRVTAEREALRLLDGSCHTPIGAHAVIEDDGQLYLRLCVVSLDGAHVFRHEGRGSDPVALGRAVAGHLKETVPADIFEQLIV